MNLSTSFHVISADKKLSPLKKILWFLFNFINNNLPPKKPDNRKNIKIRRFNPEINFQDWESILSKKIKSPSRVIGDLFWKKLPWSSIKEEIGDINIFDTGCGKGLYSLILNEFSCGIKSYTGVDFYAHNNWDELMNANSFVQLIKDSSSNISNQIPQDTNFFITQSSIEHFNHDLRYFEQIKTFINEKKENIIQIHLFPSPACLWLYLLHGVRQYNFNSILKIVDVFSFTNSYFRIYPLGGNCSNRVHFQYLTVPFIRFMSKRNKDSNSYYQKLKQSILEDMGKSKVNNPSFYALIIHTNYSKKIF